MNLCFCFRHMKRNCFVNLCLFFTSLQQSQQNPGYFLMPVIFAFSNLLLLYRFASQCAYISFSECLINVPPVPTTKKVFQPIHVQGHF